MSVFLVSEPHLFNFRVVLKLDEKQSNSTNSQDKKYFDPRENVSYNTWQLHLLH